VIHVSSRLCCTVGFTGLVKLDLQAVKLIFCWENRFTAFKNSFTGGCKIDGKTSTAGVESAIHQTHSGKYGGKDSVIKFNLQFDMDTLGGFKIGPGAGAGPKTQENMTSWKTTCRPALLPRMTLQDGHSRSRNHA
jgi:hypothetical protein